MLNLDSDYLFMIDPTDKEEKAKAYFLEGYNCSQAVLLAFQDEIKIPKDDLARIASSFGGGMGRMREVCGAFSMMALIYGYIKGYATPETGEVKAEHYKHIQEMASIFKKEFGSYICRTLLNKGEGMDSFIPSPRDENFYESRPCLNIVGRSAYLIADYLNNC